MQPAQPPTLPFKAEEGIAVAEPGQPACQLAGAGAVCGRAKGQPGPREGRALVPGAAWLLLARTMLLSQDLGGCGRGSVRRGPHGPQDALRPVFLLGWAWEAAACSSLWGVPWAKWATPCPASRGPCLCRGDGQQVWLPRSCREPRRCGDPSQQGGASGGDRGKASVGQVHLPQRHREEALSHPPGGSRPRGAEAGGVHHPDGTGAAAEPRAKPSTQVQRAGPGQPPTDTLRHGAPGGPGRSPHRRPGDAST